MDSSCTNYYTFASNFCLPLTAILLILCSFTPFLFYLIFSLQFPVQLILKKPSYQCAVATEHCSNILFEWQDLRAGTIWYSAYIQHPVKSRPILQQPEAETPNDVIRSYCHITQPRVGQGIRLIFRILLLKSSLLDLLYLKVAQLNLCTISWTVSQDSQVKDTEINALFSIVLIWKSHRNYFSKEQLEGNQPFQNSYSVSSEGYLQETEQLRSLSLLQLFLCLIHKLSVSPKNPPFFSVYTAINNWILQKQSKQITWQAVIYSCKRELFSKPEIGTDIS